MLSTCGPMVWCLDCMLSFISDIDADPVLERLQLISCIVLCAIVMQTMFSYGCTLCPALHSTLVLGQEYRVQVCDCLLCFPQQATENCCSKQQLLQLI